MTTELIMVTDERGVEIWFVDARSELGSLIDSRFFETERAAMEWMAMGGEDRCVA